MSTYEIAAGAALPEHMHLFPRYDGVDFDALVADIRANGQLEPGIIYQDMILDGRIVGAPVTWRD